jgi:hypothetical protein
MATSLQRAMWDDQERRYGSAADIQGWLDKAAEFEAQYGTQPSAWERMRQIENTIHGITPNPPSYKKPVDPTPTTPSWKEDQFLLVSKEDSVDDIYKQSEEALAAASQHDLYNAAQNAKMQSQLEALGVVPVPPGMQGIGFWAEDDITSGDETKSWSKWRDLNQGILATDEGATGLDDIAMKQMKQGHALGIDPVKTMTGLLGVLSPNLTATGGTGIGDALVGSGIAQKIGTGTGNTALLQANTNNSVKALAQYYTGRVKEIFERISAGLVGIEGLTDEDDPL